MEKIIIKPKEVKKYIKKYNYEPIQIGIEIENKVYYDDKESNFKYTDEYFWYPLIATALNIKDEDKKYEYIFNKMCEILDSLSKQCDFKCNQCIANRLKLSKYNIDGCCYFSKDGQCQFLVEKKCMKKSISCKLYMCDYIERQMKMRSLPKNYPLISYFFDRKQQEILQHSYKKNYEEIKNKLIYNKKCK